MRWTRQGLVLRAFTRFGLLTLAVVSYLGGVWWMIGLLLALSVYWPIVALLLCSVVALTAAHWESQYSMATNATRLGFASPRTLRIGWRVLSSESVPYVLTTRRDLFLYLVARRRGGM